MPSVIYSPLGSCAGSTASAACKPGLESVTSWPCFFCQAASYCSAPMSASEHGHSSSCQERGERRTLAALSTGPGTEALGDASSLSFELPGRARGSWGKTRGAAWLWQFWAGIALSVGGGVGTVDWRMAPRRHLECGLPTRIVCYFKAECDPFRVVVLRPAGRPG